MREICLHQLAFGDGRATLSEDLSSYRESLAITVPSLKSCEAHGRERFRFKASGVSLNGTRLVASANTPMSGRIGEDRQAVLHFVLAGRCRFEIDRKVHDAGPGSVVFMTGQQRTGTTDTRSLLTMSIDLQKLRAIWRAVNGLYDVDLKVPEQLVISSSNNRYAHLFQLQVINLCREIDILFDDQRALEFLSLEDRLYRLAALSLFRTLHGQNERPRMGNGTSEKMVTRVEEYARMNLDKPLTLTDLAAEAGVSVRSLHNAFASSRGTSPSRWLRNIRLERARQLLLNSREGHSITAIAYETGFGKPSAFAYFYRRYFGEYPSDTLRGRRSAASLDERN